MNSSKLQEHLDRADAHAARARDATARQAAYIEALARDGHDADTARKLLRAFEEMEARSGGMCRSRVRPGHSHMAKNPVVPTEAERSEA